MVASCLSPTSLYGGYLRRCFTASGLSSQTIDIDHQTSIHFWGPTTASHKPVLLLIHGFGPVCLWQWRRQVQFFCADFDIYVPDLIFFGDSTTTSSDRTEVFQAVSIGKLLEKLGIERYAVMGTSYGGFVAYHMAYMWPERVEKVVIASSAVNLIRRDNEELLQRAKLKEIEDLMLPRTAEQLRTLTSLAVFKRLPTIPNFLWNDIIDKLYSDNREEKKGLLKGLTLGREDTPNISPLQQEVLIIWGDHDQIFPLEKAIELKEVLGEKAKLEVMKKTAHMPQVEFPERFNAIVKNFLCA
ncbi:2-hydroxy-6-oxononadienedioate/2-hydroxy-6-oxononatrienedioate hydrolase [Vitis riparia]|uniref:2-hydroxy-6-oxononadienedioate/2-hydroxy-6- oxononatrienedioate hydrolase n=1 Tax=Vitis riparia TaxID=96939 RepID=UPI00155ABC47|nr:2-hydroxy-6-oxononadienedioate/2-hydroxy-6-oxononatrienedioate hydrolase [Vitis riparia]